jgi:hypothetical protein
MQRAALVTIALAQDLDVIITDGGLDGGAAEEFRAAGVQLEIVNA